MRDELVRNALMGLNLQFTPDLVKIVLNYAHTFDGVLIKKHFLNTPPNVTAILAVSDVLIVVGYSNGELALLDLATCTSLVFEKHKHTQGIKDFALIDKATFASCSNDHSVRVWDLATRLCTAFLAGHSDRVLAVAALSLHKLASSSADTTIKVWDLQTKSCLMTLDGHDDWVHDLAALSNDILVACSSSALCVWDTETGICIQKKPRDPAYWICWLVATGNDTFVSGCDDGTIHKWARTQGLFVASIVGRAHCIRSFAALPHNQLAAGTATGVVNIWDDQKHVMELPISRGWQRLAALPNGNLVCVTSDGQMSIWM